MGKFTSVWSTDSEERVRTLHAFFEIIRPVNVAIAGLSILLAAGLVRPFFLSAPVIFAILSGMLITAGANVINDICDIEIDRINKPQRVLPSGRLGAPAARRLMIILFVCGIIFSIFISLAATLIAAATTLVLVAYSLWLKRQPLIGNLAVSVATALAFIYGALAASVGLKSVSEIATWHAGIFPAVFSFFFHFGREVVKDIEDQAGDRAASARTLPLAYGLTAAQITATLAFAILAGVMLIPYAIGWYRQPFLWGVGLGVYPVLIFATFQLWLNPTAERMRTVSHLLKADMLVGLLTIYLGTYGQW